jgi:hypothetical protein
MVIGTQSSARIQQTAAIYVFEFTFGGHANAPIERHNPGGLMAAPAPAGLAHRQRGR